LKDLFKHKKELKTALRIVWEISAMFSILILAITFFVDESLIISQSLGCKTGDDGCFLCGSTQAFLEIRHFNFKEAYQLNKLSIFIFGLLVINSLLFVFRLFKFSNKSNA